MFLITFEWLNVPQTASRLSDSIQNQSKMSKFWEINFGPRKPTEPALLLPLLLALISNVSALIARLTLVSRMAALCSLCELLSRRIETCYDGCPSWPCRQALYMCYRRSCHSPQLRSAGWTLASFWLLILIRALARRCFLPWRCQRVQRRQRLQGLPVEPGMGETCRMPHACNPQA